MSNQDIIALIASLIITLCLPIWIYATYKLLPVTYDRLVYSVGTSLRIIYAGFFTVIDKWADDWQKR